MSMRRFLIGATLICLGTVPNAWADDNPRLGVPVNEAEVTAADFLILPDGQGLLQGISHPHHVENRRGGTGILHLG